MKIDCSRDLLAYHFDEVTLSQDERNEMRDRRDANRKRVRDGLEDMEEPKPLEFCKQGSYAMKTMVHHPDRIYDIDDGVYFDREDLKGPNGGDKSAFDARSMVRDAVDDGSFKTKPEARRNCVRVYYEAGYHVDLPVYRRVSEKDIFGNETVHYELAGPDWKRSDARDVTDWFYKENQRQSPDKTNGRQMRRVNRFIKKFGFSRATWEGRTSGFLMTKLVAECYRPSAEREDVALYYTMRGIRDRLNLSLVVNHPVTPNETITDGSDDPKARFLRDKLNDAISWLDVLFTTGCTREQALSAWDTVFNTDYFSDRLEEVKETKSDSIFPGVLTSGLVQNWSSEGPRAVVKEGGGRYA